jgi:hypothetical protein
MSLIDFAHTVVFHCDILWKNEKDPDEKIGMQAAVEGYIHRLA